MEGYELAQPGHSVVARMKSADGRFQKNYVRGTWNIELLLSQGWVIIPSSVNRLLPEYLPAEKPNGAALKQVEGAVVTKPRRKHRKKQ